MYARHEAVNPPEDQNATVWRYMDFTKYVSLISRRTLFFSTPDRLGDPFEGSVPLLTAQERSKWIKNPEVLTRHNVEQRRWMPVSCWHLNEHESAAMWRLFLKSDEGVAIKSSFAQLCDSLRDFRFPVFIGLVRYLDFGAERVHEGISFAPLFCKRKSFEHEREIRAMVWPFNEQQQPPFDDIVNDGGLDVPVDVATLVAGVHICPMAPAWFAELVRSVTEDYGLGRDLVVQSSLVGEPIF